MREEAFDPNLPPVPAPDAATYGSCLELDGLLELPSAQFRELEASSGIKDARHPKAGTAAPPTLSRVERRLAGATVLEAFLQLLLERGFDVPESQPELGSDDSDRVVAAFPTIGRESEAHWDLYLTCEHLIEYDEFFQFWRFAHAKTVERTTGMKWGTGDSPGVPCLEPTLSKRFLPEFWEVPLRLA